MPLILSAALALTLATMSLAGQAQVRTQLDVTVRIKEDRTTAIVARLTPLQREHGRLHQSRKRLKNWNPENTKLLDELISLDDIIDYGWVEPSKVRSAQSVVTSLVCGGDAVFIARNLSFESFPTEDGTLLFTDYELQVNEVLRTARKVKQLTAGRTVIGTRPGGRMRIERGEVVFSLQNYPPLEAGRDYLFIADAISRTHTFDLVEPQGVFEFRKDVHGPSRGLVRLLRLG